ncbi:sigma-70-like protein [Saccharothrix carnea]|uniref:Sigma-70-like protein n=1 Tax=Saccharothrix carnea TaxID=1280637 RepID=A0A2P8IHC0_SACCR|nr:sigma factor [Saccharothrix carnea]PSL57875.1 sigma-70-like protein [Saccharothrix carnea]
MSSDAELIGRSLRGDTDAFVEVISRHETVIGNYLARRVGRQAAEDVLGDVWVAAYESRASYDRSTGAALRHRYRRRSSRAVRRVVRTP